MNKVIATFFLILLVVVNTGCAKHQNNEPIKVGINTKISSQILYLSQVLGYYPPEDIEISTVKTDAELSEKLSNETIDVAAIKLDCAQKILKKSNAFKIVLLMNISKEKAGTSKSVSNPNMNVLIIRKSIAEKNPQKVATLLNGWYSTLAYIDNHPEQNGRFL